MGNCLKAQAADDMSLLPGSDAGRFSVSSDQLGMPPAYDPEVNLSFAVIKCCLFILHCCQTAKCGMSVACTTGKCAKKEACDVMCLHSRNVKLRKI